MGSPIQEMIRNCEFAGAARFADDAAKAIAEHCDARIAKARKAIAREEKYLFRVLRAKNTGGVMAGDIEESFGRLRAALAPKE